jgi:hypothetical protein
MRAARQVKDAGSISNAITIGAEWDLASTDLVHFARPGLAPPG